jgi:hypothetical protein
VNVNEAAKLSADRLCQLLPVAGKTNLFIFVQGVPEVLHFLERKVMKSQPLNIKYFPKAVERILATSGAAYGASHARITLEGVALVH